MLAAIHRLANCIPMRTHVFPTYLVFSAFLALSASCANSVAIEQTSAVRCGWFENPTPANAWLTDRDGEWNIGVQGGHQAEGDWPEFKPPHWVRTNGNYGYGCACMNVQTKPEAHRVIKILSSSTRTLRSCREDPLLKEPVPE